MLAKVTSAAVFGVDAYEVQVEVDIAGGLPAVMVVGLPDAAVQESKERVRAAIKNAGFPFPASRIVVNLAPADVRKEGPAFDLPIAVAVLAAQGVVPQAALQDTIIAGELALDGAIRPVRGAINISLYCAGAGIKRLLVNIPKPGEVSLAHRGLLFLDEFPEFSRKALEVLRQPLEDGIVTISRARASLTFPARFMLVASQNPCQCGYFGDSQQACSCTPTLRQRYRDRISGPLLDRIDLRFSVPRLSADDLLRAPPGESSETLRVRVAAARALAVERQGVANAHLTGQALRKHARLGAGPEAFARAIIKQLSLSGRGYDRLLRVARTIADLSSEPANENAITESHLAEAVSYREVV